MDERGEMLSLGSLDLFAHSAAAMEAIGAPAPESLKLASRGLAIDDAGRIIGVSGVMAPPPPGDGGAAGENVVLARAFLWTEQAGMIDLNDLLPAGSAWTLEATVAFDATGRIIGLGARQGEPRAYRLTLPQTAGTRPVMGDLTGEGAVGAADLHVLLAAWGSSNSLADLNGDGVVDASDLSMLMSAYTAAPE